MSASQDLAREVGEALVDTFGPHVAMDGMVLAMHALGEIADRPALLLEWLLERNLVKPVPTHYNGLRLMESVEPDEYVLRWRLTNEH